MKTFLSELANDLYSRYGSEVSDLHLILPSRRARLFFSDSLSAIAKEPLWEPQWGSIDEIMVRISGVEVGERIRLVAELYKIYAKYHPRESFDSFFGWGEVLLNDFDMIDKYMIPVDQLLRNVSDIKELECDLEYLTEQQKIIVAFWSSIGSEENLSEHKRRFLKVWRSLLPIYNDYRERLTELGIAYTGMVHRLAADRLLRGDYELDEGRVVVAGFNALSECERVLFDALKSSGCARFYWDWDDYYSGSTDQEAGIFLEKNRLRYPAAAEISHDNFAKSRSVEVSACSSSALQCKCVADILRDLMAHGEVIDQRTAIVLTDEALLMPLLYALPPEVGGVNVTMGFPLRGTLAYSFVERLLELQRHARSVRDVVTLYHVDVVGVISHPYVVDVVTSEVVDRVKREIADERLISIEGDRLRRVGNDLFDMIFVKCGTWLELSDYLERVVRYVARAASQGEDLESEQCVEFLSFIADNIVELRNSALACGIELSTSVYVTLLRRELQKLRIPFEGEPLEGLQVMGILETRNLDFERVIILSMDDDNFPGNRTQQPSFIPYNLRAAYDLPTPEHHDGVYAYYFYRLIQRSRDLRMLYCSRADDKSTGEQSRYITQLEYETKMEINRIDVGVDVNLESSEPVVIPKVGRVAEQLRRFREEHDVVGADGVVRREIAKLSPTALFRYVACPLKFYFASLAHLRSEDELTDEVDAPMFGNILHDSMQNLYQPFVGQQYSGQFATITSAHVADAVDRAISGRYLRGGGSVADLSGNLLLVREVVINYIERGALKYDLANPPIAIDGVEIPVEHYVDLGDGIRVRFWGRCDRVDRRAGGFQIVDYKSGTPHLEFAGIERLFHGAGGDRLDNVFQTLLYSYMLRHDDPNCRVTPSLYYVRAMNDENYSPLLRDKSRGRGVDRAVESYDELHEEFEAELHGTLRELFDESIPFRGCNDIKSSCSYCDFNSICRPTAADDSDDE